MVKSSRNRINIYDDQYNSFMRHIKKILKLVYPKHDNAHLICLFYPPHHYFIVKRYLHCSPRWDSAFRRCTEKNHERCIREYAINFTTRLGWCYFNFMCSSTSDIEKCPLTKKWTIWDHCRGPYGSRRRKIYFFCKMRMCHKTHRAFFSLFPLCINVDSVCIPKLGNKLLVRSKSSLEPIASGAYTTPADHSTLHHRRFNVLLWIKLLWKHDLAVRVSTAVLHVVRNVSTNFGIHVIF